MRKDYSIGPLGDRSIIIEWEQQIDPAVHQRVMRAYHSLQRLQLPYILDLIPAYASLTVVYDAGSMRRQHPLPAAEQIRTIVTKALDQEAEEVNATSRLLEIPVCYHPSLGLDIEALTAQKNLTGSQLIDLHTSQTYIIYMLGFLPGFPYMGKVRDELAAPRLKQPRLKVPVGSVGIAGAQTGIYPMESPGGWNIIGRTPLRLFDPAKEEPCYCRPGDQVRFVEIGLEEFNRQMILR